MDPTPPGSRVAVVGSGIAGLVAARRLDPIHRITLYEADARPGGHSHTHDVEVGGRHLRVDTGFLVHNRPRYPLVTALFDELGVETIESDMSFGVRVEGEGTEWASHSPLSVFAQPSNLARPRFLRMLADVVRANRRARAFLAAGETADDPTLGEWLRREGFGGGVVDWYLVPLGSAIWSADPASFDRVPARFLFTFLDQHGLLAVGGRPRWRTVAGGSRTYVRAVLEGLRGDVRLGCAVRRITRGPDAVRIDAGGGSAAYDAVVLACHADQALALLADPTAGERAVLGGFAFQRNEAVLHTDPSVLPRARRAWAAWNVLVAERAADRVGVTYLLNRLQRLEVPEPVCVTLNREDLVDPRAVLARVTYEHPVVDRRSVAARAELPSIQGPSRTWFAGAWTGWGFHEDGARSGAAVAAALGAARGVEVAR